MLLTKKPPFHASNDHFYKALIKDANEAVQRRKINIDNEGLDLVVKMIAVEPTYRPTVGEIKEHPFMTARKATQKEMKEFFR